MPQNEYLAETPILNFTHPIIQALVTSRGWSELPLQGRIGASYDFVRNETLFGYNENDTLTAARVLSDGYGQCNTKGTLLMALLRALGVPCRLHGFSIHKSLQRGIVPEAVYWMAPNDIIHSWVEVEYENQWLNLEGFILDQPVITALKSRFPERKSLCAYGVGSDSFQNPNVEWLGASTYIQKTGINNDFGVFSSPDEFYAKHEQKLLGLKGLFYRSVVRHWMNWRVSQMRRGIVPTIPGGDAALEANSEWQVF